MKEINKIVKDRIKTLRPEQLTVFNDMQKELLKTYCYTCGFGKGYLMITDIMYNIVYNENAKIFVLCSHRLGLNDQHTADIFKALQPMIGKVAFAFVGSNGGLDMDELSKENRYNILRNLYNLNKNSKEKISYDELSITTTSSKELDEFIKKNYDKKIVIISTYHSLYKLAYINNIYTLYCDEAHEMASDFQTSTKSNSFIKNYLSIKAVRKFFFSGTPKDCSDDPFNTFLMNNTKIFGERLEMSHLEAVNKGYVVSTIIKKMFASSYVEGRNQDFGSIENISKFVISCYDDNVKELKKTSSDPDSIAPKILVRCSSVKKDMWPLFNVLKNKLGNVKLFASASVDESGSMSNNNIISQNGELLEYDIENNEFKEWTKSIDRKTYIEALQAVPDNEPAIVLHHDTISEGLNVPGFTAFIPLTDKLITNSKLYQNLARALRLNTRDKKNFAEGKIKVDGDGWVKPNAYIYIPYWSDMTYSVFDNISRMIMNLETKLGAKVSIEIPYGTDHASGYANLTEESSRKRNNRKKIEMDGVIISTFYKRMKEETIAESKNNEILSPLERINHFKKILNARNS